MVDDGRDHGDDRRATDGDDERYYEQRREPVHWKPTNGWLTKLAGGVTALVFLIVFLMNVLGWRFTGNAADIKANRDAIAALQLRTETNATGIATNTQSIATLVASSASQARDIADIKSSINSLIFVNCAVYAKVYAGAPTISECVKASPTP